MLFNKKQILRTSFGVPFFDVSDVKYPGFCVPVAVRGNIVLRVKNFKKIFNENGIQSTKNPLLSLKQNIQNYLSRHVKNTLFELMQTYELSFFHIESKIERFSDLLKIQLVKKIKKDFDARLIDIDISAIEIDKTSYGYQQLLSVTQNVSKSTILAEAEAKIKTIREKQEIDMQNYEKTSNSSAHGIKLPVYIALFVVILALIGAIVYLIL